jgi:hypothetical protein
MNRDDGFGFRLDLFHDVVRLYIHGLLVTVGQDRFTSGVDNSIGCGCKGHSWNDYFVSWSKPYG